MARASAEVKLVLLKSGVCSRGLIDVQGSWTTEGRWMDRRNLTHSWVHDERSVARSEV